MEILLDTFPGSKLAGGDPVVGSSTNCQTQRKSAELALGAILSSLTLD